MNRTFRALALGTALALAIPAATFAATASGTTTATATVNKTISLAGVPATYNIGAGNPGDELTGPDFTLTITSSELTYTLSAQTTAFVGSDTIPATALKFGVNGGWVTVGAANQDVQLGANPTTSFVMKLRLTLPAVLRSGAYTGTTTWTAAN